MHFVVLKLINILGKEFDAGFAAVQSIYNQILALQDSQSACRKIIQISIRYLKESALKFPFLKFKIPANKHPT